MEQMQLYLAEFLGTFLLILLGNGVVANVVLKGTKGYDSGWIVITAGWGMAVFIAVLCVTDISGAHINPAVTIGLAVANRFPWAHTPGFLLAQLLGAMAGAATVYLFYQDHYRKTDDADMKLATFATIPAVRNYPVNLFSEMLGTLVLVLAVLRATDPVFTVDAASHPMKDFETVHIGLGALGALPVGLVVFAIGVSLGGTTGYAINPARDLGPRIAHALLPVPGKRDNDWSYAWVPIVGPILGCIAAAAINAGFNAL